MMNRILKRPMFRRGGSAGTGITSGLDTPKRGLVDEPGMYSQPAGDMATGTMDRDEIIAQAMADAQRYSPSDPMSGREMASRFLIPFGLNFASATPTGSGFGGLLATAAGAAKDPAAMLIRDMDKRRDARTERESDLFGQLLQSGLSERKEDKKLAAEQLKDNREFLTLYDNELQKNVIVMAGDVYKDLSRYGPSKKDETGKTFEKLEVANLIDEKMSEIFELEAKENKTAEDEQAIAQARGVLEKGPTTELLLQQAIDEALEYYIENGSFPPDLSLAKGGRVEYQMGGDVDPMMNTDPKIDYETLRARLPREISDDIVKLISASPEALEDFATIQTQQDVVNFNTKYNVELILPAEA